MVLFIDTHLNSIVIIIYSNKKIIKQVIVEEKEHSKVLMPLIASVLDEYKPDSIVVVNGPGYFTSVRLGVTVAKTLAYTLSIPIRTITSLECLSVSDKSNNIFAISDNNGYYIGKFNEKSELIDSYNYLSKSDFNEYCLNNNVSLNVTLDYINIIEFALKKKSINPHQVNPIYVKKLDLEK